jgi:hypothetical protein
MNNSPRNTHRAVNNATTWQLLIFDSDLPAPAKLIACYLRTHMNDYQEIAFPSVARIAGYTSQSERTVQAHLKNLCSYGYLQNKGIHQKYGTTIYNICTPAAAAPPQLIPNTPAGAAPKLTNELTKSLSKTFKPPTIDQLREYQAEKGFTFDPDNFIDYWSSVGWKRGRTPMKDWKATARSWARNEKNANTHTNTQSNKNTRRLSASDRVRAAIKERDSSHG